MLSEAELALIAGEVRARSGAALPREGGGAVEMRLQPAARREGFGSVNELIAAARIRPDGALWARIADALAQSETRFFRDRSLFERLRTQLLPEASRRRGHERVRVWSAACSTGQEAYSLAMLVEDLRSEGANPAIEIVATDLSERLLDKARAGLYTQFEVQRGLPIRKLIAHFEKAGDLWRISDRLRASVRFARLNLLQPADELGRFDIVLLPHVLAGFDAALRAGVLARAADALSAEGAILLGPGETLPAGCEGLELGDCVVRKAGASRRAA